MVCNDIYSLSIDQPPSREPFWHPSERYTCKGGPLRGRSEISCNHKPQRLLRNHWDLGAHGRGKECLPETSRPGFISTVRPDLPQPTHRLEEEDTLRSILFLRLKTKHLRPKDRLFKQFDYTPESPLGLLYRVVVKLKTKRESVFLL